MPERLGEKIVSGEDVEYMRAKQRFGISERIFKELLKEQGEKSSEAVKEAEKAKAGLPEEEAAKLRAALQGR